MNESLGTYLKNARKRMHLTLRNVEEKTEISNAYLSQLENEKIVKPSPVILNRLAKCYKVSYERLMRLAEYPLPRNIGFSDKEIKPKFRLRSSFEDITEEEEKKLREYLEFLRSKKR